MMGFLLAVPLMVFSVTMGAGIIIMFVISAIKGMPSSLPAGMIIGLIMLLSVYFSYLFLREVNEYDYDY
jgi:thiamine transporter ThiT